MSPNFPGPEYQATVLDNLLHGDGRVLAPGWLRTLLMVLAALLVGWAEQGEFNKLAREGNTVVTISDRWNATWDVSMVPDAVVLGFHGQGATTVPTYRTDLMKKVMEQITKRESAQAGQVLPEAR